MHYLLGHIMVSTYLALLVTAEVFFILQYISFLPGERLIDKETFHVCVVILFTSSVWISSLLCFHTE